MTFLPIVDRELRVAARRRATYWTRLGIALAAIIVGGCIFLTHFEAPETVVGPLIFIGLSILGLLYCLLAGRRSTVDCLSEEKREGTLGLLFLTDLKGHDVVLGKLAATSLNSFYGLLALFPVLAVPLMMGGISNGQFWRMVLVLVNTFLFSLALGILVSARSREARRAVAANLFALVFFALVLPLFALLMQLRALFYPSPIFSFVMAFDLRYVVQAEDFWWSMAVIHGLSWWFILRASRIVPHSWQDQTVTPEKAANGEPPDSRNQGERLIRRAHRKRLLDVNAFYWLAARDRRKPAMVWMFLGFVAIWWFCVSLQSGLHWFDDSLKITTTLLLNTTFKLWIALEAGQRLAEDKKSGALELLLSSPLTVRDILRGQLLALRRQFLAPVAVVVATELFFLWTSAWHSSSYDRARALAMVSASLVMLLFDVAALTGVAMFEALVSRSQAQASSRTVLRLLVLPWLVLSAVAAFANAWAVLSGYASWDWNRDWKFFLVVWFVLGLVADAVYGLRAWRQLQGNFRRLATERSAQAHLRPE